MRSEAISQEELVNCFQHRRTETHTVPPPGNTAKGPISWDLWSPGRGCKRAGQVSFFRYKCRVTWCVSVFLLMYVILLVSHFAFIYFLESACIVIGDKCVRSNGANRRSGYARSSNLMGGF